MFNLTQRRHRLRMVIPAYPAFNIYSSAAQRTTALGPVCVATSINKMSGWDVEVIDENNLRRYGPRNSSGGADHELLQKLRFADVVGLYGGLTSTIPRLYAIAKYYKSQGVVTVAGGQHFCAETVAEAFTCGVDYVVFGEGEETLKELLLALMESRDISSIAGLAYLRDGKVFITPKREQITDFDKLPLPDFSLVRYARIEVYPVERIRGCGMDCEFCTVKGKPRVSSPERLLERISAIIETRDAKSFFVVDDLFGQQRDETIRFCSMLRDYQKVIGRRLDLGVQIRLDKAKDPALLCAMREAGINFVAIGFESPIAEELVAMNKHLKPEDMLALTRIYRNAGFLMHGMFIFGYPAEKGVGFSMPAGERVKHFRRFIRKSKLDTIQVLLPVPLPGTELRERFLKEKRVYPLEDIGWEYYDGNFPLFEPDPPLSAEELQSSVRKIMGKFYQFRYLFMVGVNIFSFPSMVFFLHNINYGWRKWYRLWRNYLIRFGGWIIMRKWTATLKSGTFSQRLKQAKKALKQ